MKKNLLAILICTLALAGSAFALTTSSSFNVPALRTTLIRYDPFPVQPGNYVNLYIQIDNTGSGDSTDTRLKIVPTYPFSIDANSTVTISNAAAPITLGSDGVADIGIIPSLQNTVVQYKMRVDPNALEGNYAVNFWSQPQFSDSWSINNFTVLVQGKDQIEISQLTPSILTPGKPTDAMFVLNNSGTALLHDISIVWSEENNKILPLGSQNRQYISSLSPGQGVEIPFTIIADPTATAGVYNLNVTTTYQVGSNTTKTISSNIGVFIGGQADFDVSVQDYQTTGVSFSVANVGATPTTSVSISIPDQPDFAVTGTSSSFLGNLNPGDFTLATFQLSLRGGFNRTSGSRDVTSIPIDISYTDTNGVRQNVEKDVPIQVSQLTGQAFSGGAGGTSGFQRRQTAAVPIYIPIGALVVIVVVLYLLRKKIRARFRKKKTDKN